MPDLSNLLSITIGALVLGLVDYSVREEPEVRNSVIVGRKIEISGTALLEGATHADLVAKMNALRSCQNSIANVTVKGFAATEIELLAATCSNGPIVKAEILEQSDESLLCKPVRFTVSASTAIVGESVPRHSWKKKVTSREDELRIITQSGEIRGSTAEAYFTGTILPAWYVAYPWPNWVVFFEFELDPIGVRAT